MYTRKDIEKREYEILSPLASKAAESKGREFPEDKCDFRTDYQRDSDRIIHSKAFRRLLHKTQVFIAPDDDHFRTRLTHTLEVAQVSKGVARILRYNEDLTEAIALGHDLGHTPFGHLGESILNRIHPGGFMHNVQSLRTVDKIEETSRRVGLNLTYEVRDGILNHRGGSLPVTREGQIVKICDRIAYVNHDIDDAIRSGILTLADLPADSIEIIGKTHSDRINNLIIDLCQNSEGKERVELSNLYNNALLSLRSYMFANFYNSPNVIGSIDIEHLQTVISSLYKYYLDHSEEMPPLYQKIADQDGIQEAVKDLISGMTDRYALNTFDRLFGNKGRK